MTPFPADSVLHVQDNDGFPFTLLRDLTFMSEQLGRIVVPMGFQTDYASIPRALWAVLPPVGKYDRGAVLHDFLYQTGICTRGQADHVLKEAMEAVQVSRWQIMSIYAGVRVGGWVTWRRYRAAR